METLLLGSITATGATGSQLRLRRTNGNFASFCSSLVMTWGFSASAEAN